MVQDRREARETFIVTGATRGLGLEIARALARRDGARVVAAVRDPARAAALGLGPRVEIVELDLGSLAAVRAFVAGWRGPIAGLVNNAGLQPGATRRTADGWEETIAVNHLAAFALTVGLLPWLDGGRVLFVGSGTIDPENRVPKRLGFRGARFTSVAALARGEGEGSEVQRGRDRYATSKFMNTVAAIELARRISPDRTRFYTLDPGMMPGTGLAREAPLPARVLWSTVLRWLVPLLPDASTPARSAATAAWILTGDEAAAHSGEVYGPDRRPSRRMWAAVREPQVGRAVVDETLELLGLSLPDARGRAAA
ncbi:SDR family NAD(P)-dependent oxidoreductase [Sorangium sp. So ce1036]|uniref:SDR family NAD(P)-dependent oxidoreductase n=1 Tax=Sorangium sp. So ce1036 TaxID=3133328 RepID=UPI003F07C0E5